MDTIGNRLQKILKDKGLNANSAAKLCGLSPPRIYALIDEKTQNPKSETIKKLAAGLNVDESFLLSGKDDSQDAGGFTKHIAGICDASGEYDGRQIPLSQDEFMLLCTFKDIPEKEQKRLLREAHLIWAESKGV